MLKKDSTLLAITICSTDINKKLKMNNVDKIPLD